MNGLKPQIVEKDNKDQAQNATESRAENREALDPNVCLIFLFCPILFVESIFDNQSQYWNCDLRFISLRKGHCKEVEP